MKERRAYNRSMKKAAVSESNATVWFEVNNDFAPLAKKAEVMNLSEKGMGLATDSPLETGQMITFVKKQKKVAELLPEMGIVMWTMESADGYKAGVKFFHDND